MERSEFSGDAAQRARPTQGRLLPVLGKICGAFAPRGDYNTETTGVMAAVRFAKQIVPPASSATAGATTLHYSTLTIQLLLDVDHAFTQVGLRFDITGNLFNRIHNRRMIAAA
jgi:hypothetical protein